MIWREKQILKKTILCQKKKKKKDWTMGMEKDNL